MNNCTLTNNLDEIDRLLYTQSLPILNYEENLNKFKPIKETE